MMNPSACLILFLLAFVPALVPVPQSFPQQAKYDRATDTTTVQIDLLSDDESPAHLTLQANAAFQGKEPNERARFWFTLTSNRGKATRKTPPLFETAKTLTLRLDAVPTEVPLTDYRKEHYELIQRVSESANAVIGRTELPKLLTANQLAGQWGAVEFKLTNEAFGALKAFIKQQTLVAPPRIVPRALFLRSRFSRARSRSTVFPLP
jgi:hypothetical protein